MPSNPNWGPILWSVLHMKTLTYYPSVGNSNAFRNWVNSLPNKIPCRACADHFVQLLDADPVDDALSSKTALVAWAVRLHNTVNAKLGKPEFPLESVWDNQLAIIASGLLNHFFL